MSRVRHKRRCAARLLRSHMTERRMIRRMTQTSNTIFSHYSSLLLRNDLLPWEMEALHPGSTRVCRPGLNPFYVGPCENGIQWNLSYPGSVDQGVPVTLKLPVTLNLFMNHERTVHGYIKTLDRWKERAAKLSPSVGALTLEHP